MMSRVDYDSRLLVFVSYRPITEQFKYLIFLFYSILFLFDVSVPIKKLKQYYFYWITIFFYLDYLALVTQKRFLPVVGRQLFGGFAIFFGRNRAKFTLIIKLQSVSIRQ
jgi:hypothetical protein